MHFDLEGYDLLLWDPDDLPALRSELTKRIRRRLAVVSDSGPTVPPLAADTGWRDELRERASRGLSEHRLAEPRGTVSDAAPGFQEVVSEIFPPVQVSQRELYEAMRASTVSTFGWPIGIVLDNRDEFRPRPTSDGVEAEVRIETSGVDAGPLSRGSFDFWKAFTDGRFYTRLSLFEDERADDAIFWDTRTIRVTEALLLLVRLYRRLGASDDAVVTVTITHGGLRGRSLRVANSSRMMHRHPTTTQDEVDTTISASLNELETELPSHVRAVVEPLLMVFDFYDVAPQILDEVSERFIDGQV